MGRIQLLDDQVINKIAAGEVVERPASVVKELVENALDAGARQITVSLDQGGTKRIVVSDDGEGMDREDAFLALKRHATSKIRAADDLFHIDTMGFRGEALASIASVSRFSLATTAKGSNLGLKLMVEPDGQITELPWQGAVGTTIVVEDLFYNIPARAKFLKSMASEYGQCLELIQALALCHPQHGFTLVHNGKEQFRLPPVAVASENVEAGLSGETVLRQRAKALFPNENVDALIYTVQASRHGKVEMLASAPGVEKASGRYLFTYVNGRWVKDKALRYGILRGYQSHLLKGRYPFVVAHLHVDPSLVDVNVHPAKTEVRFQYAQDIQTLLALGLREAIRQGAWAKSPEASEASEAFGVSATPDISSAAPHWTPPTALTADFGRNSSNSFPNSFPSSFSPARSTSVTRSMQSFDAAGDQALNATRGTSVPAHSAVWDSAGIDAMLRGSELQEPGLTITARSSAPADVENPDETAIPWAELEYVGVFDRCYLLFSVGSRLLVLDQHAFHERVLFERLCRDEKLLNQTQPLLMPESIELSPTEVATLAERREELCRRGFGFSVLNETLLEVQSVPVLLAAKDMASLFADLAAVDSHDVGTRDLADSNAEMSRLVLATIACHAAVRAGEELGENELKQLLNEAKTVDFYHNCPHGRRVFKWWTRGQVARWFDR